MSGVMKVVKVKGTHLFNALDWKTIRNAIEIMNMVVVRATLLAKLYNLTVARGPRARTPPPSPPRFVPTPRSNLEPEQSPEDPRLLLS
jgi:hypothetical protein